MPRTLSVPSSSSHSCASESSSITGARPESRASPTCTASEDRACRETRTSSAGRRRVCALAERGRQACLALAECTRIARAGRGSRGGAVPPRRQNHGDSRGKAATCVQFLPKNWAGQRISNQTQSDLRGSHLQKAKEFWRMQSKAKKDLQSQKPLPRGSTTVRVRLHELTGTSTKGKRVPKHLKGGGTRVKRQGPELFAPTPIPRHTPCAPHAMECTLRSLRGGCCSCSNWASGLGSG